MRIFSLLCTLVLVFCVASCNNSDTKRSYPLKDVSTMLQKDQCLQEMQQCGQQECLRYADDQCAEYKPVEFPSCLGMQFSEKAVLSSRESRDITLTRKEIKDKYIGAFRVLKEGGPATMDYSHTRINLMLGKDKKTITNVNCG